MKPADEPRISFSACSSYAPEAVSDALDKALKGVPGWDAPFTPGKRVIVKPNLLSDCAPEEAVTTHPEVVRAIIRKLKPLGVSLAVADSPASAVKLLQVWERTGFADLCAQEQVPLLNLEQAGSRRVEHDGFRFNIATPLLDADIVVNVPKVKSHVLTTLTCGVKNLYGMVPGYLKAQLHKQHPHPSSFGRLMRAIHGALPPALTIADGIVGMEGNGPANGQPCSLGFLAVGNDAVALDLCVCRLLGIPPAAVPYLSAEAARPTYARIAPVADSPETLALRRFAMPNTLPARLIPEYLVRLLAPLAWIRPVFNSCCIRCGRCVEACPVEALALRPGHDHPQLSPRICIGCCCCHEICPAHAVDMRQSALLRLWSAMRR